MKKSKTLSCILAVSMLCSVFAGCNQSTAAPAGSQPSGGTSSQPVELKAMLSGDKPTGWDNIIDEFEKETKDTLNLKLNVTWIPQGNYKDKLNLTITAKEDYDLVFDAPWNQLKNIAPNGGYADLGKYFNNDSYPGLKKAFPAFVMNNNKFFGKNYAVPIMRTYGTGIPCVFYRQDLADKYGVGKIDNYAKLQNFFDQILANEKNVTPLAVKDTRGFYQLSLTDDGTYSATNMYRNNIVTVGPGSGIGFEALLSDDHKKVQAIAADGDPDSSFGAFPAPFNRNWTLDKLEREHSWNKYLEKDSLNQKDDGTMFTSGKAAARIGTLDDYEDTSAKFAANLPDASLGEFIYVPEVKDKEQAAISTTYMANNFLCVPATSKKIDSTMKFLDWLFSDQKNHDLFELGIEGKNWEAAGDDGYKLPEGVSATSNYTFPGYVMTWNKNYVRFSSALPENVKAYKEYELQDSTFYANPLSGFTFDNSPVKTEIAKVTAIYSDVMNPLMHGVLASPSEVMQQKFAECRKNGLDTIEKELVKQINAFLAAGGAPSSSSESK